MKCECWKLISFTAWQGLCMEFIWPDPLKPCTQNTHAITEIAETFWVLPSPIRSDYPSYTKHNGYIYSSSLLHQSETSMMHGAFIAWSWNIALQHTCFRSYGFVFFLIWFDDFLIWVHDFKILKNIEYFQPLMKWMWQTYHKLGLCILWSPSLFP